ncbi:protein-glutamate O-methyltransferase CheR [Asticcacaulis sp. AC402]|uniref:CheR family methyltransferase n=1 Tax=Asticcacaulis sp. AC402 TaxID=1282361 RepID=UPI0003C3CF11|nr:protein-glutamate O-methyltransferase CheR [Asticcacaulis sp. AC402]ESQ77650.1 chemotaxis protein CheR [Asticcacaulis sp. AC402]
MALARKSVVRDLDSVEFDFSRKDFDVLAALVHQHTGIVLGPNKQFMVYSRLTRRLRERGLTRFDDYIDVLNSKNGEDEFRAFINAMTTNLTRFFREKHHFEYLAQTILPLLRVSRPDRRLRIWSAGCSSGEEPYSIAMTLQEHFPELPRWDARILATDIDTNMVAKGAAGLYPADAFDGVDADLRQRYFTEAGAALRAKDNLRHLTAFKPLNLLQPWPVKGPFDVIFCRNVMIYFDNPTKTELIRRFAGLLRPGGWLIVGHSETLLDQQALFSLCGRTIYRRLGSQPGRDVTP